MVTILSFRPRFTVRRLMIAVAIAGACCGGLRLWNLSQMYQKRAYHCAYLKATDGGRYCNLYFDTEDSECADEISPDELKRRNGLLWPPPTSREVYYHRLEHEWRHAARYPWLPVKPDPPEPE